MPPRPPPPRTSLAALVLLLALAACAPAPLPRPRLVVLYAPCTVSKRCLTPYDPALPLTPNLAAFARESALFTRHVSEAEQSGPAYAALFSGTHANRHGAYSHPVELAGELYLLAEAFADGGYETWFWSGHQMAGAHIHYGQGVPAERTLEHRPARRDHITPEEARALSANEPAFEELLTRLEAEPGLTAFVQVNFTLTHGPYSFYVTPEQLRDFCARHPERCAGLAPAEIEALVPLYEENQLALQWDYAATAERLGLTDEERARLTEAVRICYEASITELDRQFGDFLARIRAHGLEQESVVVFTADHGEVLGRDSALFRWTHGFQLAPESLEIPLIVRAPGRVVPGRYEEVTRSIDVFPTLAGLCGLALGPERGVEGSDLSAVLRGAAKAPPQLAFAHTTILSDKQHRQLLEFPALARFYPRQEPELMWVAARERDRIYKLRSLDGQRFGLQAFDLDVDPEELHDRFEPGAARDAAMAERLAKYRQLLIDGYGRRTSGALPGEAELESLRSLGYVR